MQKIGKLFLQGLLAVLPTVLTIYLLYWMVISTEAVLGRFIQFFLQKMGVDEGVYITGMGVIIGFLLILGIGILMQIWIFRTLLSLSDRIIEKIPVIKSVYGAIRDLAGFFDPSQKNEFSKTVMVDIIDENVRLMGLVTRETFDKLPKGIGDKNTVAVYLPMSYQMGGFTAMVPKEKIHPVDMKVDEAMQFVLSAGVSTRDTNKKTQCR